MSFDLLTYARKHRYRVRNLHDGHPVPPARPPKHGDRGHFSGYRADGERDDAIVCRRGYVTDEGDGRIGWFLYAPTTRRMRFRLRRLAALGVTAKQEGDTEAAGDAPVDLVGEVLRVLHPYQRRKALGLAPPWARRTSAAGRGGT